MDMNGFKYHYVDEGAGSTVIINVHGVNTSLNGGSMNLLGGLTSDKVIVNYPDATSLLLGFEHEGMVLAPNTTTVSVRQSINGVAILGGSVTKTDSAEFHNFLFTGDIAHLVPEPSSSALLAMGSLILFLRRRS